MEARLPAELPAGVEGGLIMVAAASIAWVAIQRLLRPVPLEDVSVGLAISAGGR